MSSINDLLNLTNTTIYIPNLQTLNPEQQKVLSTYLMIGKPEESSVIIVCGSTDTITKMSALGQVDLGLLKHFNVFNILRDTPDQTGEEHSMESLKQCAQTILGAAPVSHPTVEIRTKSYHLIPR